MIFFLFRKKRLQAGFEPWSHTTNQKYTCSRPLGYGPAYKCSDFLLTSGEPSVNRIDLQKSRIDLQVLTSVGPLRQKPVPDHLAVQLLENRIYMLLTLQSLIASCTVNT